MDLSIVIVNYNTRDLLTDCIDSIIANVEGINYEIIVVDNSSVDGSVDMLKTKFPEVQVIQNESNRGFAAANNQGIQLARGANVLLLNSDTIIISDCLSRVFGFIREEPQVGIVGCRVIDENGVIQHSCYHFPNLWTEVIFFLVTIIKDVSDPLTYWKLMKYWRHDQVRSVDCISGCFFWARREVFEAAGLLDEEFFMYYEDSELCNRIRRTTSYKIKYFPHAEIIHLGGKSSNPGSYLTSKQSYVSARYYLTKCFGQQTEVTFVKILRYGWKVEKLLFMMCQFSPKFKKKAILLDELIKA